MKDETAETPSPVTEKLEIDDSAVVMETAPEPVEALLEQPEKLSVMNENPEPRATTSAVYIGSYIRNILTEETDAQAGQWNGSVDFYIWFW